jgi:hypothetical protein
MHYVLLEGDRMTEIAFRTRRPGRTGVRRREPVGRPKTANTEQLVVRVPPELRRRLEALVPRLAPAGVSITVTDVVRAALLRGVEALEAANPAEPPKAPRRK